MSTNNIVRRIVSLPMSIIGGFSRAISLMGSARRDQRVHTQQPQPQPPHEALVISEEWLFPTVFEQHYGVSHPFFYACRFSEALKIAEDESKFLFVYLHSPEHPYTAHFCNETLCSEVVVHFLDANFVSWGAFASQGEGLQMSMALRVGSFPFCAIVVPVSSGNSITVLQQVEGPVSPAELVEILQRTVEEQGLAFTTKRENEEEKRKEEERSRANRQLRAEQDAAYLAALQMDKEKNRFRELIIEDGCHMPAEARKKENYEKLPKNPAGKQPSTKAKETQHKETIYTRKDPAIAQILIRFPNGERREQSFLCTDKIQSIYRYIDSLNLPGVGSYRLIANFPKKVYGFEQLGMTLKDAGLHPTASLFLELV